MYGFVGEGGGSVINQAPQTTPFAIHRIIERANCRETMIRSGFNLIFGELIDNFAQRARRCLTFPPFKIFAACEKELILTHIK